MLNEMWDFIIVGGGLGGSVLASRLFHQNTTLSILLVEAGPDVSNNTIIPYANNSALLIGSDLDWRYVTVPQLGLDNRPINNPAGKALGGGTAINSCGWIRGDVADYDEWAEIAGDQRWSYNGMLPYMKATEHHWTNNFTATPHDLHQHGFAGPVWDASVSSTGRLYPLRDTVKAAWVSAGFEALPEFDGNDGHPRGVAELVENRHDGLRQLASSVYPLKGVTVLTNTLVKKVLLSSKQGSVFATGIELANGTQYFTRREVIVSAGAYRTPQVLLLSGIGPKDDLKAHDIEQIVDSPALGQNLWDHLQMVQTWKLRNPSSGVAVGSTNPLFSEPQFGLGLPTDWIVTSTVPVDGLKKAIEADEGKAPGPDHPLLKRTRSFLEMLVLYAAAPYDGSTVGSSSIGLMPTSRGTVKLNTTNPADAPTIDPQYYSTEVDRYTTRTGIRAIANTLQNTPEGKALIDSEVVPAGFQPSLNATDTELDAYIRATVGTSYHPGGTAAMGKVVDNELRVKGVSGLRIVDASVIPAPIAAHLQVAIYALANQAADIILSK